MHKANQPHTLTIPVCRWFPANVGSGQHFRRVKPSRLGEHQPLLKKHHKHRENKNRPAYNPANVGCSQESRPLIEIRHNQKTRPHFAEKDRRNVAQQTPVLVASQLQSLVVKLSPSTDQVPKKKRLQENHRAC
jgi:hypothetical protein